MGYLEPLARERFDVATATVRFDQVARAVINDATRGMIKIIVDRGTWRLLGCHVIGARAAELVYDAALVIRRRGRVDDLAQAVGIFPTFQEGVEGTARALLRRLDPEVARGPLAAA